MNGIKRNRGRVRGITVLHGRTDYHVVLSQARLASLVGHGIARVPSQRLWGSHRHALAFLHGARLTRSERHAASGLSPSTFDP